jgi:hypothetical protein
MKRAVTYPLVFNPTAQTLVFASYPNFDLRKLFAVWDISARIPIYAAGEPGLGFTQWVSSTSTMTLQAPLGACSANDVLMAIYDDGDQAAAAGFAALTVSGAVVATGNPLPVSAPGAAQDTTLSSVLSAFGSLGTAPPSLPNSSAGLYGLLIWLGGLVSGLLSVVLPGGNVASGNFTRPATLVTYASGQIVANSGTAASVAAVQISVSRANGISVRVNRVRLAKTGTTATNASFRVHLYSSAPTAANGDGGTWDTSGASFYMGSFDVTSMHVMTDGCVGIGLPTEGTPYIIAQPGPSSTTVYALVEARAAYSSPSGETFMIALETEKF